MTNSHGYILEYPRIRVDHFDQNPVPLPKALVQRLETETRNGQFSLGQHYFDKPLLYLLTHIHTDHLKGLDRPGLTAPIYCSFATKNLLLRYERQDDRVKHDTCQVKLKRPYSYLQVSNRHSNAKSKLSGIQATSKDLLHPLPYNTPIQVPYTPTTNITLTLLESNHMFGGTMFLVQGPRGAVLHTGDLRAEDWWCQNLVRNPAISRYTAYDPSQLIPTSSQSCSHQSQWVEELIVTGNQTRANSCHGDLSLENDHDSLQNQDLQLQDTQEALETARFNIPSLRLENIYLDTELLLCNQRVPPKTQATRDMITLIRLYPPDTIFFLNVWTWGYEAMLKAVAKSFGVRIHVDRFKAGMYKAIHCEDPFLTQIITLDPDETRFHACERANMCQAVMRSPEEQITRKEQAAPQDIHLVDHRPSPSDPSDSATKWSPPNNQASPLVVFINPAQVSSQKWQTLFQETKDRLEAAQQGLTSWPETFIVPLERHSPLPELQHFVGLFRPKTVSPNTILDPAGGLDYYLLPHLFGHLLSKHGRQSLLNDSLATLGKRTWEFYEKEIERARIQAQPGGKDSVEANASPSDSHESYNKTVSHELQVLSRSRGIAPKGIIMHSMAGNIRSLLEIERWRRQLEATSDFRNVSAANVYESFIGGSQSQLAEQSAASIDYFADESQAPDLILPPSPSFAAVAVLQESTPSMAVQPDHNSRSTSAGPSINSRQPELEPETTSSNKANTCQTQPSLVPNGQPLTSEPHESPRVRSPVQPSPRAELTEDLTLRYINILIHHFKISYVRSPEKSHVAMWKQVRRLYPDDAKKVELLHSRENRLHPPSWRESDLLFDTETTAQQVPAASQQIESMVIPEKAPAASAAEPCESTEEHNSGRNHDMLQPQTKLTPINHQDQSQIHTLDSILDLLDDSPPDPLEYGIVIPNSQADVLAGYQLLLDWINEFSSYVSDHREESLTRSSSHPSSSGSQLSTRWRNRMPKLFPYLIRDLVRLNESIRQQSISEVESWNQTVQIGEECIKICALLLACFDLSCMFRSDQLVEICENLLVLVENSIPNSKQRWIGIRRKRIICLAGYALQHEEVDRQIIVSLEDWLINAANGPIREMVTILQLTKTFNNNNDDGEDDDDDGRKRFDEEKPKKVVSDHVVVQQPFSSREVPFQLPPPPPSPPVADTAATTITKPSSCHTTTVKDQPNIPTHHHLSSSIHSLSNHDSQDDDNDSSSSSTQQEESTQEEQQHQNQFIDTTITKIQTKPNRISSLPNIIQRNDSSRKRQFTFSKSSSLQIGNPTSNLTGQVNQRSTKRVEKRIGFGPSVG